MTDQRLESFAKRMDNAIDGLNREFSGLRTGRASVNLLDSVKIESYGAYMPINQVGTVNVSDSRLIIVQVWDKSLVKNVEKGIREAGLGLNPAADGQTVKVPLPSLTEERRNELSKIAAKYAEDSRINVRNVRREGMDFLKKLEKTGEISEDDLARFSKEVQQLTDDRIKKIDDLLLTKQKDIMKI